MSKATIENDLALLGIKSINKGTSTGSNWFGKEDTLIDSFSPVDGSKIASVTTTSSEEYAAVVSKAK